MKQAAADLRHRIMDAGIRLFAEKGFFAVRVEDIARRARVAKGTIYLYFKDKPSLYAGILDHQFQDGIAILKRVRDQDCSAVKKLATVAQDWLNFIKQFRTGYSISAIDNINLMKTIMRKFHEPAMSRIQEIYQLLAEIIRQGISQGEFRQVDPMVAAHCFFNVVRTSSAVHMFLPGLKNAEQDVFDIFLKGLIKPVIKNRQDR